MATGLVGGALALLVAAIIWKLAKERKSGNHACCGDCAHCHGACQYKGQ